MFKKYKPFFRAGAMDLMVFKFNMFTWFFISIFQVACIVFLWIEVYQNSIDGVNSIINGFTFKEMICYIVMINIFTFVTFDSTTLWTINDEVRNGTIAMTFTKPISYRLKLSSSNLGSTTMCFIILGIPAFTIAYIVFILIGFISFSSVWSFLLYLLLFLIARLVALLISDSVNYIFGVLSFYTTSEWGLNQIKDVIISFLSGSLIPLAFFPGVFKDVVKFLPFAGMAQNPVLIMLMKVSYLDAIKLIGLGLIWLVILELFGKLLFNHASKKITVQGG